MGINTWETRQERDDACLIIAYANPTTARFGRLGLSTTELNEIHELISPDDLADMPQRQEQQELWERRRRELILGSQHFYSNLNLMFPKPLLKVKSSPEANRYQLMRSSLKLMNI